jgi:hypothetical protein
VQVAGQVHGSHAAGAELGFDPVLFERATDQ